MQGDMNNDSKIKALYIGHEDSITSLVQDDEFVLTGSADSTARLYDAKQGECLKRFKNFKPITVVNMNENFIVTGEIDGNVRVYDKFNGAVL